MSGTAEGGQRTAQTNKEKYGENYYSKIGAMGGKKGKKDGAIKGFAAMSYEKRAAAGRAGGKVSKRGPAKKVEIEPRTSIFKRLIMKRG